LGTSRSELSDERPVGVRSGHSDARPGEVSSTRGHARTDGAGPNRNGGGCGGCGGCSAMTSSAPRPEGTTAENERSRPLAAAPSARLVGREADIAQVDELLGAPDARLVTIIGPGGVGKTSLALALIARTNVADRRGFVALADVSDPALIPATILRALGVEALPGQSIEAALAADLHSRQTLLVLDNLEHLTAAPAVAELLADCPGVQILATSRIPIGLAGERQYVLAPLEVPARDSATALDAGSVRLFVTRVRLVLPEFRLTPANLADAVDICRIVDGLPLAIELAAAQCRQLAPRVLAARLLDRAALTASGSPDAPPRHRSMQATLAWTVALLEPAIADLWRALGVFEGGFTLEAAEAVAAAIGLPVASVPTMLDELELHQLVRLGANSLGEPRYSMLPITREVAVAALEREPTHSAVLEAHADEVVRCCADAEPGLMGTDSATWFARLEAEIANIRAVLGRDRAAGRILRPLTIATHLHWFWTDPGYLREGYVWLADLLAVADDSVPASLRSAAFAAASSIADWLDDTSAALGYATQALALANEAGDRTAEMEAMLHLGNIHFDESDLEPAERYFREGHVLAQELQDVWHMAAFANLRATLAAARGDALEAVAWHRAAVSGFRSSGHQSHLCVSAVGLGVVLAGLGELDEATSVLLDAIPLLDRTAVSPEATMAIAGAATIAMAVGLPVPAVRLLGAATQLRSVMGLDFRPYYLDVLAKQTTTLRTTLDAPAFGRAWNEGSALTLIDALDLVVSLLDDVPRARLTAREREVLQLLIEGASDVQIATRLYISRHTASKHVAAILDKLGAPNRTTAVAVAYRRGLVTP